MGFAMSALDVYYLVKELRPVLQDAFVDKIYQGKDDKGDFLIKLRSPNTGKQQLYVKVPDALFITEHKFTWPQSPPGFCMQLRKHLMNARLTSIEQKAFERIILFRFEKGPIVWTLIVELFSKGNIVLVTSENLIRGVMDLQRWKDRTLRVNASYEFPPSQENTPTLSKEQVQLLFTKSDTSLVKFCATTLGLGGRYAEELVARTGLDKNAMTLSKEQVGVVHEQLQTLFQEPIKPAINEGVTTPFPLRHWRDYDAKETFSAAIESLIVGKKIATAENDSTSVITQQTNKFQKIIDEQTNKLKGYELSAKENQAKGEKIYERYQDLQVLFKQLQELHKKGGWPAVKKFIKEKNVPIIVNEQKGLVTLEIK